MSICGIDCSKCSFHTDCQGCDASCGRPFGGACIAAEYIGFGGKEAYAAYKSQLLIEINSLLKELGVPLA